jgi:hypothetical protein
LLETRDELEVARETLQVARNTTDDEDSIQDELALLREQLEEYKHKLKNTTKELDETRTKLILSPPMSDTRASDAKEKLKEAEVIIKNLRGKIFIYSLN